jgi:hypothetical protein
MKKNECNISQFDTEKVKKHIVLSIENDDFELFNILIRYEVNHINNKHVAMIYAIENNKIEFIHILLSKNIISPYCHFFNYIEIAVKLENEKMVELFVFHEKAINIISEKNYSMELILYKFCKLNYIKSFSKILKNTQIEVNENYNELIKFAFEKKYEEIVRVLFNYKNIKKTLYNNEKELYKQILLYLNINAF